ncbi:MAG: MraY family glycosyltransferase [Algisphaera sp.]
MTLLNATVLNTTTLTSVPIETSWITAYAVVFATAFMVALATTPVVRFIARKYDVVDHPDLVRKHHKKPVAYLGGLAIFIGWFAGIAASYLTGLDLAGDHAFPLMLVIGAGVITFTGLVDDVIPGVQARQKIGGQLFAAAALTSQRVGFDLTETLYGLVHLYPNETVIYCSATCLVAIIVLGGCNAVNLIDGLDGLSSGVVAIAMASFLAIAVVAADQPEGFELLADHPNRVVLALATLGALAGFLPFNWNPASIFMGDAGSLLLGFLSVSAILLMGDVGNYSLKLVTASLVVFAVPITDTSLAIIRRKLRGQPIFSPDSQHLHHLLRRSGLSVKQSVLTMYAGGLLFGAIGIAMIAFRLRWRTSIGIVAIVYAIIMLVAFRYGAHCLGQDQAMAQAEPEIKPEPESTPSTETPSPTNAPPTG